MGPWQEPPSHTSIHIGRFKNEERVPPPVYGALPGIKSSSRAKMCKIPVYIMMAAFPPLHGQQSSPISSTSLALSNSSYYNVFARPCRWFARTIYNGLRHANGPCDYGRSF